MLKLAFFKGPTDAYGKAVRLLTAGPYSHVELLIDDVAFASSPGIGTRYLLYPGFRPEEWDYASIPADVVERSYAWNWCMSEMGCPHDPYGVFLSSFGPLACASEQAWFSSEFCANALKIVGKLKGRPERFSPNSLARLFRPQR